MSLIVREVEDREKIIHVQELCFYCEENTSEGNKSWGEEKREKVMTKFIINDYKQRVGWFLPRHYSILFVPEDNTDFFMLKDL